MSCFNAVINPNRVNEINLQVFNELIDATCNFCGISCSSDEDLIYQVEWVLSNLAEKIISYIVAEYESLPKLSNKQKGKRKVTTGYLYSAVALHLYINEGMKSKIEPGFISFNGSSYSIINNYSALASFSLSNIISIFMYKNTTDDDFFPAKYCLTYMDTNFYKNKSRELTNFIDYARAQEDLSVTTDPTLKARINKLLSFINTKLIEYLKGRTVGVESTIISKGNEDLLRNIRLAQEIFNDELSEISLVLDEKPLSMQDFFGLKGHYVLSSPPLSGKSTFAKRLQNLDDKYLVINCDDLVFENTKIFRESLTNEIKNRRNIIIPTYNKAAFEKEISKYMLLIDHWDKLTFKQRIFARDFFLEIPNLIIISTNFFPKEFRLLGTKNIEIKPLDRLYVYGKLKREKKRDAYAYNELLEYISFSRYYGSLDFICQNYSVDGDNVDKIVTNYFNYIAPPISQTDKNACEKLEMILRQVFDQKLNLRSFSDLLDKDNTKQERKSKEFEKFISENRIPYYDYDSLYESNSITYYSKIIQISDGYISFQYVEFLWLFTARILMSDSEKNRFAIQNGYELCGLTEMWKFFMYYFGLKIEEPKKGKDNYLYAPFGIFS
jgi:hypothetical protein